MCSPTQITENLRYVKLFFTFRFQLESGTSDDKMIVFFKIKPDVITPDNVHTNVFVSSMLDSPVSALYHSLQKVFAPVLLKDEKWSKNFDPKLQKLMSELEAGLGSVIRRQDPSGSLAGSGKDVGEDNLGGEFMFLIKSVIWMWDTSKKYMNLKTI